MSSPRMPIRLLEDANIASAYPRELVANFTSGDLTLVGPNGTSQVKIPGSLTREVSGTGNGVTDITVSGHKVTITKGNFLTAHPTIDKDTDTTGTNTLAYSGSFSAIDSITRDDNGHVTKISTKTITIPAAPTSVSGNAGTATKLAAAKNIILSGAVSGSASFDGSADAEIEVASISAGNITGLADVATSGSYNDLSDAPALKSVATSGSYNDLSNKPTIPAASTIAGADAGTAAVGTSTAYARADHVHPLQTSVSGNAGTATKLAAAKTISLKGGAVGSTSFDGSSNVEIDVTKIDASKVQGVLSMSNIPQGALERLYIAADNTARLALTTAQVQNGDCVKVTSTGLMYFVKDETKLGTEDAFEIFSAGTATAVAWNNVTGKPNFAAVATSGSYNDLSNKPTIPAASNDDAEAAGTASAGTSAAYARADHVHPLQTSVSGNAGSAAEFTAAKAVTLTGDVTGTASSKAGWSIATALSNSGVTAGSYGQAANATPVHGGSFSIPKVTVDAKGRVTGASNITITLPDESNVGVSVTGTGNAVTGIAQNGHGITVTKGATFLTAHPTITKSTDSTSTGAPDFGETFTVVDSVTRDGNGHVTKINTKTVTLPDAPDVPTITIDSALSDTSTNAVQNKVVTAALNGKATSSHTHNYAGSSSAGGAANSVKSSMVVKLNGGSTEGTDMFTFNGASAKTVNITAAAIGAATSGHTHTLASLGAAASDHTHTLASLGAAAASHTHNYAGSASAGGAANSVKASMVVKLNGGTTEDTDLFTFNGSGAKTVNITAAAIGAAAASHTHNYAGSASAGGAASSVAGALTISLNGTSQGAYNGASAKSINITAASIGAAASSHTHNYAASASAGGAASSVAGALTISLNGTSQGAYNGSAAKSINITPAAIGAAAASHSHSYASTVTYSATIGTSWSGSAAPYTQAISVSGITASDNPIVDVKPSDTYATGKSQVEAWGSIYRIVTSANAITVYANDKTTTSIPIQLKCVR